MSKSPKVPITKAQKVLANNMKRLREARDWTQEDLAHYSNISTAQIGRLESHASWISPEYITKMAKAFKCDETELFLDPTVVPAPTIKDALNVVLEQLKVVDKISEIPSEILESLKGVDWENPNVRDGMKIVIEGFSKKNGNGNHNKDSA